MKTEQSAITRFVCPLLLTLLLAACTHRWVSAQTPDTLRSAVDQEIERLFNLGEQDPADLQTEEQIRLIRDLALHPLNINRASVDELMQIPALTLRLAQAIIVRREEVKPYEELEELLDVQGIGPVTYGRIIPFLTIGSRTERHRDLFANPLYWTSRSRFEGFTRLQRVLQTQEGYQRADSLGGYTGSPYKYYHRFRYQSDRISLNITQEKDPGEPLPDPLRFDFTSMHLSILNAGSLRALVVGDYSLRFGQGLILWNGASFGKGSSVSGSMNRSEQGVRPYTSAQETDFFRGAAVTWGNNVQITGFFSSKRQSATKINDSGVRFPSSTGLHRTRSERERRRNTSQTTYGGRVRMEIPAGFIGVTGYLNRYGSPVIQGDQPWQQYLYRGRVSSALSSDFRVTTRTAALFGEAGRTHNGGWGGLTGVILEAGSDTDLAFSYRYYGRRFQSILGSTFGEQSGHPQNEEGFYIGVQHAISGTVTIRGYIDRFRFPAPRYLNHQASSGYDWLIYTEYKPDRNTDLYLRLRYKVRGEEYSDVDEHGRVVRLPDESRRLNARLHLTREISPQIRLRSRVDWVRAVPVSRPAESGILLYQDFRYRPTEKLSFDSRITWFRTDGFDSRVYQFENDLLYVLSNTMLYQRGWRGYLLIGWEPDKRIRLWAKISMTIYNGRTSLGSGLTEIKGNRRSDFGIQMRIRL